MNYRSLLMASAVVASVCGCTAAPVSDQIATRVSADYIVRGDATAMHAFVYGTRTVLDIPNCPFWLSILDENGVPVPYEREGPYYRLSRKLERFTVWANARVLSFQARAEQAPGTAAEGNAAQANVAVLLDDPLPTQSSRIRVVAAPSVASNEEEANELLRLARVQLDEVRQVIAAGAGGVDGPVLRARLDRIEAQLLRAATVMVRIQFDTASTAFVMDQRLVRALVPAAKAAQRINVRGRTDARIAGKNDARIALGRALAARRFLVEQGVEASKIRVYALAAGRSLGPTTSVAGRALNRRVEIELVDRRYAQLALAARQTGSPP